jgi:hypothetical protein
LLEVRHGANHKAPLMLFLFIVILFQVSLGSLADRANPTIAYQHAPTHDPLRRVFTYWINFSIYDGFGGLRGLYSFEFYVTRNQTTMETGIAEVPVSYQVDRGLATLLSPVKYTAFRNVSGLFEELRWINGTRPANASPAYGGPYPWYVFLFSCGFPCVNQGFYVAINDSGTDIMPLESFSYWFHASNLVTVYRDGVSVESPFTIVVNATFQDANGSWVPLPNVSIKGATYTVTNTSDGLEYIVRTGSIRPPSDYTLAGGALTAGLMCVAILYRHARRWRKRGHTQTNPTPRLQRTLECEPSVPFTAPTASSTAHRPQALRRTRRETGADSGIISNRLAVHPSRAKPLIF